MKSGTELLDHPLLWRTFVRQLNGDIEHDRETIREFCHAINLPPGRVIDKIKTFLIHGNTTIN